MSRSKSRLIMTAALLMVTALLLLAPLSVAFAANPPGTGQPGQSCEDPGMMTPGHSGSGPGSAFSPDGQSGTVYAGEQPQNSNNPHSVSQYDVACFQVSQH